MKQSEFLFRLKLEIPNMKESGITDNELVTLINQGVNQTNLIAKVYKGYTDFNVVAEQQIYELSTVAPTFLGMSALPLKFLDSNSQYQKIYPKTKEWIENIDPDWENADSTALPTFYWVEGNDLGFYQKPSTSRTNGARLYHLKKGTPMSNDDHYPFTGSTTEITAFIPLDDAIIAYVRWKLSPAIGAVTDADLRKREFLEECAKGLRQIKRRPDITSDSTFKVNI